MQLLNGIEHVKSYLQNHLISLRTDIEAHNVLVDFVSDVLHDEETAATRGIVQNILRTACKAAPNFAVVSHEETLVQQIVSFLAKLHNHLPLVLNFPVEADLTLPSSSQASLEDELLELEVGEVTHY